LLAQVIIIVAVLIAVATSPINVLIDFLFDDILAAPLVEDYKAEVQAREARKPNQSTHPPAPEVDEPYYSKPPHELASENVTSFSVRLHEMLALPHVSIRSFPPSTMSSYASTAMIVSGTLETGNTMRSSSVKSTQNQLKHLGSSGDELFIASPAGSNRKNDYDNSRDIFHALEVGQAMKSQKRTPITLKRDLMRQYEQLCDEKTKLVFRTHWGFDPATNSFCDLSLGLPHSRGSISPESNNYIKVSKKRKMSSLSFFHKGEDQPTRECQLSLALKQIDERTNDKIKQLKHATDMQIGLEIMHQFIIDLLGQSTPAAKIFESMTDEAFTHSMVVTKTSKRIAWVGVVAINAFFVFFTVLRGITSSVRWQQTFLVGAILQMIIEIFVFLTMECLWIHYTIPRLVDEEVEATMATVNETINLAFDNEERHGIFNSPEYFFTSRKLAERYPNSFESSIVLAFQSYFPPCDLDLIYHVTPTGGKVDETERSLPRTFMHRFSVSALITAALQHLGTIPIRLQQVILHTLQPIMLSFIVLLYFFVKRNPFILLALLGLLVYELLAYVWKSRTEKKILPMINDAKHNTRMMEICAREYAQRLVNEGNEWNRQLDLGLEVCNSLAVATNDTSPVAIDMADWPLTTVVKDKEQIDCIPERYETDDFYLLFPQTNESNDSLSHKPPVSIDSEELGHHHPYVVLTPISEGEQLRLNIEKLDEANKNVEKYLIMSGMRIEEDYKFNWNIDSDEYKYLYNPDVSSFTDKNGKLISVGRILARRGRARESNEEKYHREAELARIDIERQKKQMMEWDHYRTYRSPVLIPFVDSCGRLMSEQKIKRRRGMESNAECPNVTKCITDLDLLMIRKQQCEYELMIGSDVTT
jgi:hypothetical protein